MKYLLILGIVFYLFYKVSNFFFKAGAASQQLRDIHRQQQAQANAEKEARKNKRSVRGGGEYIDYEEVK